MLNIPFFLLDEPLQRAILDELRGNAEEARKQREEQKEKRLKECIPWHPKMPWKHVMNLRADSYHCLNLFPEVKAKQPPPNPNAPEDGCYVDSPSGMWRYVLNTLPRGAALSTWCGSKIGSVLFDGPVEIPAIYKKRKEAPNLYEDSPWMSLTPAELMSMRTGLRLARGHTIVAGLGLGHLLINVTKKKSVKKVTLVEISQELMDWIFPRVKPHLGMDVEVVVGDAHSVIAGMEADVALIDIFSKYGNKVFTTPHEHIGKVWVWGSATIKRRAW